MSGNFWENDPIAAPPMPLKAKSPADQKRVGDMQQGFDEANSLAGNANDFAIRNARTPSGWYMAIPGAQTVAKATGASGDDLAAMNRDTTQMATQMRTPGMRLTQMEFGKFLGANPSLNNSRANNQQAVAQINAARTGAAAKSAFYTTWLDARGSLDGADGAWLQFQSQHFSPDGQTYYHDPNDNPALKRAQGNAALKDKSAGSRATSDPLGIR